MENIPKDFIPHATTIEKASSLLSSDTEHGLSTQDAVNRLRIFGRNSITEAKSATPTQILTAQFKSPIVFLLLFAVGLSFWFKEFLDGIAILLVILINATIGFYMESKAQKSMEALQRLSSIPTNSFLEFTKRKLS